ncbi:MAG: ATP-binding protein [Gammaproteobacteria bacterium]|jgi:signal transduction histidine kinase
MRKDTSQESNSDEINQRSAHKVLELLLYNFTQNISGSIGDVAKAADNLDPEQKIRITNLKEALERMELLIKAALKTKSSIGEGDLTNVDPDVVERIHVEKVLRTLATTTSAKDNDAFFKYCVQTLAQLYECQYAFIGLLKPNKQAIETQAVWAGDGFAENFEYDLEGTPCAEIINLEKELIPTNASELYKDDELLVSMNIDSYFGAPIITKELGVVGLVSVMDTKPMELNEWTAPVLGVFASRLAIEIERKRAVDDLHALNESLEERIKERTHELEASNRELAAFSYSVSHDLRAPVRTINAFMDVLYEDFGEQIPEEAFDNLNRIKRAGKKLNQLIDDMLGLARVSRAEMVRQRVDIGKIARNEQALLQEQNPDRRVEVTIMPQIQVWGDEGLLTILYQNLLSNAWKYTARNKDPAKIEVGMQKGEHGESVFFVSDNGVGFDMRYADKLFRPFQRLHSEEEFEGNGVGLATILRIVNRHGGTIWAESEVGKGATFYFTLGESLPIKRKTM